MRKKILFDLELEIATPNHIGVPKLDPDTGKQYFEKGDEIVVLQFKPLGIGKAEFQQLLSVFKDWTLQVEVKE